MPEIFVTAMKNILLGRVLGRTEEPRRSLKLDILLATERRLEPERNGRSSNAITNIAPDILFARNKPWYILFDDVEKPSILLIGTSPVTNRKDVNKRGSLAGVKAWDPGSPKDPLSPPTNEETPKGRSPLLQKKAS